MNVYERFFAKVEVTDGCWQWTGARDANGYGFFGNDRSHRAAYKLLVGPIPPSMTIDHLCRNRGCANAYDHMEVVSQGVNVLRGMAPTALNARKTHCPRGHAYDAGNTYVHQGRRHCKACGLARKSRKGGQADGARRTRAGGSGPT